ncbi:MAG: FRG domain-containing protein, partial [Planctomycetes bacterium]|nr:FRG domain-containing protein [Planctomycetota bacterium]
MDKKMAIRNGVWDVELKGWEDFLAFVNDHFIAAGESNQRSPTKDRSCADKYVWRGEPEGTKHPLVSSFDRELQKWGRGERVASLKRHRQAFLYAVRGRTEELGFSVAELKHYVRARTLNEKHLWAFGQHYDLVTPLLDWTLSPFVAAFFAYEGKQTGIGWCIRDESRAAEVRKSLLKAVDEMADLDQEEKEELEQEIQPGARVVYGLKYEELCERSREQRSKYDNPYGPVDYFSPMSSEFGRLTSQQGIFTFTEDGGSVIDWVNRLFAGKQDTPILMKIRIPADTR